MPMTDSPPPATRVGTLVQAARIASARLRFVAVFAVVFAVIGGWETIRTYWSRWTVGATDEQAISSDTDFFCPMDPGVLSDWPSKCPVCNMTLVRRKRGDSTPMPDGVIARMQFTPYRLWLGGIRAAAVDYAPLARVVDLPGTVISTDPTRVEAAAFASESAWIKGGQGAEVTPLDDRAATALKATVRDPLAAGKVVLDVAGKALHQGERVRIKVICPAEAIEPFRSLPSIPPPLVTNEPRHLYTCMDHPEIVRDAPGRCPRDQSELMDRTLRPNQRIRWWCPMHPSVMADHAGQGCDACGGMVLVPRIVSYRLPGTVLSVPASAVIDDGSRALVYIERGGGMFDATVVTLGPRCGEQFPVVSGLQPGDRVAAQGAFLIDAETRLNPGLAAGYFGASHQANTPQKADRKDDWTEGLAASDRPAARRQMTCPVTGKPLGSMGVPVKVEVRGRTVFLCCVGCEGAIRADPETYLAKLPKGSAGGNP